MNGGNGVENTLEELYRTERHQLEMLFKRGGGSDPADLVQETFARAYASRERYVPELGTPAQWLHGIAHHVRSEYLRHEAIRPDKEQALTETGTVEIEEPVIDRVDAVLVWGAFVAALAALHVDDVEVIAPLVSAALSGAVVTRRSNAHHLRLHRLRSRLSGQVLGRG